MTQPNSIKPVGLFGIAQLRRQDFHQLLDGVPHFVLLPEIFGGDARAAGEANVFFPFAHFLEICRQLAAALKNIDLERQAAATRIIIQHVLQRRVGDETAVPVIFAVDLDRWKTGRQRAARHHMLRANGDFRAVEIGEAAGAHIHRSHAEAGVLGIVDAVEVDELFERLLERRRAVVARRHGRREPLMSAGAERKNRAGQT